MINELPGFSGVWLDGVRKRCPGWRDGAVGIVVDSLCDLYGLQSVHKILFLKGGDICGGAYKLFN